METQEQHSDGGAARRRRILVPLSVAVYAAAVWSETWGRQPAGPQGCPPPSMASAAQHLLIVASGMLAAYALAPETAWRMRAAAQRLLDARGILPRRAAGPLAAAGFIAAFAAACFVLQFLFGGAAGFPVASAAASFLSGFALESAWSAVWPGRSRAGLWLAPFMAWAIVALRLPPWRC